MPWPICFREHGSTTRAAWFEDEEVGVDFFKSAYITRERGTPALNEFHNGE